MVVFDSLHVYNFYSRQLEEFRPLIPSNSKVGMYVCGPTASGESHLGHARPFITFDIIYRYLRHLKYDVRYVRNITDAGHFEEDGRVEEDKISSKAKLESLEPMELVHKYVTLFHRAMYNFNCLSPSIEPTATGHIIEQIDMIKKLIEKQYAYVVNGSVYFDVGKYASEYSYGKLSGRILSDLKENTRQLNNQNEKRNHADFALWKKAPPKHIMRWSSPWGEGFPGWHIECSAMSTKYLGKQFDIHGGGLDLLFPHHESEIAQSNVCNGGTLPAKYWLYNNMITVNGKKMGKSYNNQIKLSELFEGTHIKLNKAYSPMTIRFFVLQTHYRSTLDFSNDALLAAEKGFLRLMNLYETLMNLEIKDDFKAENVTLDGEINLKMDSFDYDMNADFNTAKVIASMFDICPTINSIYSGILSAKVLSSDTLRRLQSKFDTYIKDILGFRIDHYQSQSQDKLMQIILDFRNRAKQDKQYALSDRIRNQLQRAGFTIKDNKDGTTSYNIN